MALLQRRGPDSPFGDLLGWIVVFFVIVWPILRGLLETAKNQRKDFETKRPQSGPRPSQGRTSKGRRTLEEILEGKLERVDSYDEESIDEEYVEDARPLQRTPASQANSGQTAERSLSSFGDRPDDEGSAPVYSVDDLKSSSEIKLGADPFDEAAMERDLVSDATLSHVPSEDELETSIDAKVRPMKRHAVASAGYELGADTLRSQDPEAIYRGMGRPLSPWQKAFILKEVLGAPLASRPEPTLTDLPS